MATMPPTSATADQAGLAEAQRSVAQRYATKIPANSMAMMSTNTAAPSRSLWSE